MSKKLQVTKVTLPTGKVVLLREIKIGTVEFATQKVAVKANGDSLMLQMFAQKELLKSILYQVDGKPVSASQAEDLDSLFSYGEYSYLNRVIGVMTGGDEMGKAPINLEILAEGSTSSPKEA